MKLLKKIFNSIYAFLRISEGRKIYRQWRDVDFNQIQIRQRTNKNIQIPKAGIACVTGGFVGKFDF